MVHTHFGVHPSSPGLSTPVTMESRSPLTPSTPGTISSVSTAYSVGSRTKRLGHKLSFWKKREASAEDLCSSMRTLQRSHQAYTASTQRAFNTLREWSKQLSAPAGFPKEWQSRLASPEMQALLLCVCQAMHPICVNDVLLTQIYADFRGGFRSLGFYEENCRHVARELSAAERRYYKERRRCTQRMEALTAFEEGTPTETVAGGELAVYESACLGLRSQMSDAGAQYQRQCHTELPRQFQPALVYMQQKEEAIRLAVTMIQSSRMDYPPAEFGATPGYDGVYSHSNATSLTAPLRYGPSLGTLHSGAAHEVNATSPYLGATSPGAAFSNPVSSCIVSPGAVPQRVERGEAGSPLRMHTNEDMRLLRTDNGLPEHQQGSPVSAVASASW